MPKGDANYEARRERDLIAELDQNIAGISFNAFQRELQRQQIDPKFARLFTLLFERQTEIAKQCAECAQVLNSLANSLNSVVQLHAVTLARVKRMQQRMGIVHSEDATKKER